MVQARVTKVDRRSDAATRTVTGAGTRTMTIEAEAVLQSQLGGLQCRGTRSRPSGHSLNEAGNHRE